MTLELLKWMGVGLCLAQSALFSGLTLGFFGLSRLRLEIEAERKNPSAIQILRIRKDGNFLLATLVWGNVSVNVLLTLLTDSILTGTSAFLFSTFAITLFGEIVPQAYMSKHIRNIGVHFVPWVRFYQMILWIVARPTAFLLDRWLGKEIIRYLPEEDIKILIQKHALAEHTDLGHVESTGAINFLALDDISVDEEGEIIDPKSILELPIESGLPVFPAFERSATDPFLQKIQAARKKWVVLVGPQGEPILCLDAHSFLREVIFHEDLKSILWYCHRPIMITSPKTKLGPVMRHLKVFPQHAQDDVIDDDLILIWHQEKRIITGADILGRLLRGITTTVENPIL